MKPKEKLIDEILCGHERFRQLEAETLRNCRTELQSRRRQGSIRRWMGLAALLTALAGAVLMKGVKEDAAPARDRADLPERNYQLVEGTEPAQIIHTQTGLVETITSEELLKLLEPFSFAWVREAGRSEIIFFER